MHIDTQSQSLSREQIMSTTAAILRESGYDATTIRRIARDLDCAVGSIYRYFDDKRDLLFEVAQAAIEPAVKVIEKGGSVLASAKCYHQLAQSDATLYQLAFWLASVGDGDCENDDEPLDDGDSTQPANERRRKPRLPLGKAVPPVIRRLINGWGKRLGDANLASNCWMTLHGCATLGIDERQTMAVIKALLPQPRRKSKSTTANKGNQSSKADGNSTKVLSTNQDEAKVPPAPTVATDNQDPVDDVCLL